MGNELNEATITQAEVILAQTELLRTGLTPMEMNMLMKRRIMMTPSVNVEENSIDLKAVERESDQGLLAWTKFRTSTPSMLPRESN